MTWKEIVDTLTEALRQDPDSAAAAVRALEALTAGHPASAILALLQSDPSSDAARDLLVEQLGKAQLPSDAVTGDAIFNTGGGTVVKGNHNVVLQLMAKFGGDGKYSGTAPQDPEARLDLYRALMVRRLQHIPLRGLDRKAADATHLSDQPELARVYVELDTTAHRVTDKRSQEDREHEPVTAVDALSESKAVILGKPGAGKSTFVHHFCLAAALQDHKLVEKWPEASGMPLPIRIVLRDLAKTIASETVPDLNQFWDFVREDLAKVRLDFLVGQLEEACRAPERRAYVFFDGLDEVPQAQRPLVRELIHLFSENHPHCGVCVTCRVLSYKEPWKLAFTEFELAPFSEEKIDAFIDCWYADLQRLNRLDGRDPDHLAARLKEGVRRRDLRELAPTPLHLTQMAIVHAEGELPEARADLYEKLIDLLLVKWDDARDTADTAERMSTLLDEVDCGKEELLAEVLRPLAFHAHTSSGTDEQTADISEHALHDALKSLHPEGCLGWTQRVTEAIKQRAGILEERDDHVFGFPHRTFQEHLAGYHLRGLTTFAEDAVQLMDAKPDLWREPVLLSTGIMLEITSQPEKVYELVTALLEWPGRRTGRYWLRVWRAGEVMAEVGQRRAQRNALGREKLKAVCKALLLLIEKGQLDVRERASAGRALGKLGDPRFPMINVEGVEVPKIAWSEVIESDSPDLGPPFRIAIYPITYTQFTAFERAGGYDQRDWWTEAGWEWRQGEGTIKLAQQLANHPVTSLSWYEVYAFTQWLDHHTPESVIALPTEGEWERAASHTDGRVYPWGDVLDDPTNQANMDQSELGAVASVGLFSKGKAVCGAQDMAGNVWEWCLTEYHSKSNEAQGKEARVFRGGACYSDTSDVRCACRNWHDPWFRYTYYGFRVLCRPPASSA